MGLRKKLKKFLYVAKFKKKNLSININNKNILITGANSGIGFALTKRLLSLNNIIVSTYRKDSTKLEGIIDKNLTRIKCDHSNIVEFQNLEKKLKEFSIDIVINCAGIFGPSFEEQQIENIDLKKFQESIMINSLAIIKIIQLILKNKPPIMLINVSSDAGSISNNNQGNAYIYRTSKSALNSITKNMSIDLYNRFNTIVFAVDPGNVESGMNPGGHIKADHCANLIIDLASKNLENLNGKFLNLLGHEISW